MSLNYPVVSVVIPCRNERDYISLCVESVFNNGYPGDLDVLVIDGLSDDGTRGILRDLQSRWEDLRVIDNPHRIAPTAMNIGIQESLGEVVIILGAHCELGHGYIETVALRLISSGNIGCVGGRTVAKAEGFLPEINAAVLSSPFGVGNAYFRIPGTGLKEVDTVAFGAYRREIFTEVGGFDERLVRNQDIEFNSRMRRAGYKILLDPTVDVYYRPRRSLHALWRQNFGNGYWNIITTCIVPGTLSWRHFVPLIFVLTLCVSGIGTLFWNWARLIFLLVCASYLLADLVGTMHVAFQRGRFYFLSSFFVFPVLHISYGLGSLWGIITLPLMQDEVGVTAGQKY